VSGRAVIDIISPCVTFNNHPGSTKSYTWVDRDYDPTDRRQAMELLLDARLNNQFLTGLIYVNPEKESFLDLLNLTDEPPVDLSAEKLRPSRATLAEIMDSFR
jgi:2-oxoglutarate ferredoxin oxidoreductase subunit beta